MGKDDLIERRRKAGSFVAHPQVPSAVLKVPDLALMIAARGDVYRWKLTHRSGVTNAKDDPLPALLIEAVHYRGCEPFPLGRPQIALHAVPDAADEKFIDL